MKGFLGSVGIEGLNMCHFWGLSVHWGLMIEMNLIVNSTITLNLINFYAINIIYLYTTHLHSICYHENSF